MWMKNMNYNVNIYLDFMLMFDPLTYKPQQLICVQLCFPKINNNTNNNDDNDNNNLYMSLFLVRFSKAVFTESKGKHIKIQYTE